MDYYGKTEAVNIAISGRCAFNDNRATSLRQTKVPVAVVTARSELSNDITSALPIRSTFSRHFRPDWPTAGP